MSALTLAILALASVLTAIGGVAAGAYVLLMYGLGMLAGYAVLWLVRQ